MWIPPGEYILDRWEGQFAVLEGEDKLWDVPRWELPSETAPGDVLQWDGQSWQIDQQETQARKARIQQKMLRLFGKKE